MLWKKQEEIKGHLEQIPWYCRKKEGCVHICILQVLQGFHLFTLIKGKKKAHKNTGKGSRKHRLPG